MMRLGSEPKQSGARLQHHDVPTNTIIVVSWVVSLPSAVLYPISTKSPEFASQKYNFNPFHHCLPHWFPGWSHDGLLWSISKVKSRSPFPSCTTPINPKPLLCRHYFPAAVSLHRSLLTMKCPSPMKSVHSSFKTQMSPPLHFFCLVRDHVTF